MKRISMKTALLAVMAMTASCEYVKIDKTGLEEIGVLSTEYELPSHEGVLDVSLMTSGPSTITDVTGADWLDLSFGSFDSDCTLKVAYEANEGFPRYASLLLSLDSNPAGARDTVTIRQRGLKTPYISFPNPSILIRNAGEDVTRVQMNTNLPEDAVKITTRILDGSEEWISDVRWEEGADDAGTLLLTTSDNTGDTRRTAVISFSYDNGWNTMETVNLRLTQPAAGDDFGTLKTFEEIRALATAGGEPLSDDMYIEGYVVSDASSGNVNENPMLSTSSIDYDVCRRSLYIESLDGKYGFLALTVTAEDNVFVQDNKVRIALGGVTAKKMSDPERYVLDGLSASSLLEAEAVSEDAVPVKEMYIRELTDADIYTRVTLKDVEFPIRKGSLSPCFERMTNAADVDVATKFATLLRDIDGNSMYIYTNSTCTYRRDGTRMPYGSGKMRGIIVHETHHPFRWEEQDGLSDEAYGNIGRYQIRHVSRSDFMMDEEFESSFSGLICEFRYMDVDEETGWLKATAGLDYGKAAMTHTNAESRAINSYYDFSYLGPVGTETDYYFGQNFGNVNGFGITTEAGEEYGMGLSDTNANMYSAGRSGKEDMLAWSHNNWWADDAPYHWYVKFSTDSDEIPSGTKLSLQLSMLNQVQTSGYSCAPRYWKVEWAVPDEDGGIETWNTVPGAERFAVPDVTPTAATHILSMSCAFKPMDFPLPAEMLGHAEVHMRIGPAENNAGQTMGGAVFSGKKISSSAAGAGSMNYFAVRYDK